METIKLLYGPEELPRLKRKYIRERALVWGISGLTLALCVLFCCLTTSRNVQRMELATLLCSCLGGWLVIYRRVFGLQESRHELEHVRHLQEAETTRLHGVLHVTRERLRIKNSIRIRILVLEDGETRHRLKVNETRVKALRDRDGQEVTVLLAGGYVAGIGGKE